MSILLSPKMAVEKLQEMYANSSCADGFWEAAPGQDTVTVHEEAEDILCAVLRFLAEDEVAEAFETARERCCFWYS